MAIDRVKKREEEGGHNIPTNVIVRRYNRGLKNLFEIYLPIIQRLLIMDNSDHTPEKIAEKENDLEIKIFDFEKFEKMRWASQL